MRVYDGGRELDAAFSVDAAEAGRLMLTVESRGGTRGAPNARNTEYDRGLELMLERLAARRALITDALVVSTTAMRDFPEADDRRLDVEGGYPIALGNADLRTVRLLLGRAQRVAARDPSLTSSGNNNKRIRLWLEVDGGTTPAALARELAGGPSADTAGGGGSPPRRAAPRRQGYVADAVTRRAIEDRAMQAAIAHFSAQGFEVDNVSGSRPFDLLCTRAGGDERRVEVKGTTGPGDAVELTIGEVRHAKYHLGRIALFILHDIEVVDGDDGPVGSGGEAHVIDPWNIDDAHLRPTRFTCWPVPGGADVPGTRAEGEAS